MNKKIIFCFLTALVVLTFKTDSSYSIPTISKYDENYWTPEKMKRAKPLTTKKIGFRKRSGVEPIRNTTDFSTSVQPLGRKYDANNKNSSVTNAHVDQLMNFPIGKLFMSKNGEDFTCTASLINTDNGNIGLTAAHCLYDHDTQSYFDNIMFSPGYDNGQDGPLGRIPAAQLAVTIEFLNQNNDEYDWGMLRFDFNMNGHPLQDYTGALGWQLQPGNNIPTTFRGYPDGGKLPNCPNNGETLCTWQGVVVVADDYYVVPDLEMGSGASGGPFIMNYDPNVNLGLLYSDYSSYDELEEQALAPIYDIAEFNSLIGELTPAND